MKARLSGITRYLIGAGGANLGDGIATVAWVWAASLLTKDPFLISCVAAARSLPWLLISIPAGLLADQVSRRTLMICADAMRVALYLSFVVVLFRAGPIEPAIDDSLQRPLLFWTLALTVALVGAAEVVRDNANQALVPLLVDKRDLEAANGRLFSVEIFSSLIIGPVVGAFVIGFWIGWPFALNAALYMGALLLVVTLSPRRQSIGSDRRHWRSDLAAGFGAFRDLPGVFGISCLTALWNIAFSMVTTALVLFAQEIMGLASWGFGLLMGLGAFGGLLGGLIAAQVVQRFGPTRTAQLVFFLPVLPVVGIAIIDQPFLAVAALLAGFLLPGPIWNTVAVSYRQRTVPDEILGRVTSIHRMIAIGALPVGALLGGAVVSGAEAVMAREVALRTPFVVGGVLSLALGIAAYGYFLRKDLFGDQAEPMLR